MTTTGMMRVTCPSPRLDPAVALVIAVVIGYHALALLRKILRRLRLRPVSGQITWNGGCHHQGVAWEFDADRTALTSGYSEKDLTNGGSERFVDDFVCWGMLGDELLR
jgi:hypothetical protein